MVATLINLTAEILDGVAWQEDGYGESSMKLDFREAAPSESDWLQSEY